MLARIDQRTHLFDRAGNDGLEVDRLHLQVHQPTRHARDIEQVVHEFGHVLDLATDHLARGMDARGVRGEHQQLRRGADRGQRVAQFVRQHGEELVLATVGFTQGAFAVFEGAARQALLVDVGARPHPSRDAAALVTDRHRAAKHPSVCARPMPETVLDFVDLAGLQACLPPRQRLRAVIRMQQAHPRFACFRAVLACVVVPLTVVVIGVTVRQRGPHHLWHRVGDGPEPRLAGAQFGFGTPRSRSAAACSVMSVP
jgi:hypothetical protein